MFHLPLNYSLQTTELKELRRRRALENKMDEQLKNVGNQTRFTKGYVQSNKTIKAISKGHMKTKRKIKYEARV